MNQDLSLEDLEKYKKDLQNWEKIGPLKAINILQIINQLNISKQKLKESKLGNTISSLSKLSQENEDEERNQMIKYALETLNYLKQQVNNEKKNNENKEQISNEKINQIDEQDNKLQLTKQSSSDSQIPNLNNKIRNIAVQKLYEVIKKTYSKMQNLDQNEQKIIQIAVNLDKEVYKKNEKALKDKDKAESAYKTDISQIIKTINDEKIGKELINSLNDGTITIEQMASCKSEYLSSSEQRTQMQKEQEQKIIMGNPKFYEGLIKKGRQQTEGDVCKKCRKKTAYVIQQLQTRSSDEPMTLFYKCFSCNQEWKE